MNWNLDVEKKGPDWWREVGLWEVICYRGCHVAVLMIEPLFSASLQLPDGSADQEFRGQYSAAESHLRMM